MQELKNDGKRGRQPKPDKAGLEATLHDSNDLESLLYTRDPDFKPHPKKECKLPKGFPTDPVDREVLSKAAFHRIRRPEANLILPRGLTMGSRFEDLLSTLRKEHGPDQRKILEELWSVDYAVTPPSMEEFIDDSHYLGRALRSDSSGEGLWPVWRNHLTNHFNLDSFVQQVVLTGAIGTGKSRAMVVLLLYRVCLVCCLRNPNKFLGLGKTSGIHFVLLSITRETLQQTLWPDLLKLMSSSPFFRDQCGFNPEKGYGSLKIVIPHPHNRKAQLTISGGSEQQHSVGRNVLFLGLDEGNFRLEQDPQIAAYELYATVQSRITSRFQLAPGFSPGLCVLASSASHESSFTERVIRELKERNDAASGVVIRNAIYQAKPNVVLADWWFKTAYGSNTESPQVLMGCYDASGTPIARPPECTLPPGDAHEPVPEGQLTELVPGNYAVEFLRDPWKGLQEFSGISLGGIHRLFPGLTDLYRCIELGHDAGIEDPAKSSSIILSMADTTQLSDYLVHKNFACRRDGTVQPLHHPTRLRYAHLDLATRGTAGIAICHLADPTAANPESGQLMEPRLIVVYDFILAVTGGTGHEIHLSKIEDFFRWLKDQCGFRFGLVTADMYQSTQVLQNLKAFGIPTDELSVDRDKRAYLALRTGVQEHTLRLYRHEKFLEEAAQLVESDRKVDHPAGGSKDVADAVAGAHFNAIMSEEVTRLWTNPVSTVAGIHPVTPEQPGSNPFGTMVPAPVRKPREYLA